MKYSSGRTTHCLYTGIFIFALDAELRKKYVSLACLLLFFKIKRCTGWGYKCCFQHEKHLVNFAVLSIFLLCLFVFDKENKIVNMAIYIQNISQTSVGCQKYVYDIQLTHDAPAMDGTNCLADRWSDTGITYPSPHPPLFPRVHKYMDQKQVNEQLFQRICISLCTILSSTMNSYYYRNVAWYHAQHSILGTMIV